MNAGRDSRRRKRTAVAIATAVLFGVLATSLAHADTIIVATRAPTTLKGLEAAAADSRKQMNRLQAEMKLIQQRFEAAAGRLDAVNSQLAGTRLELARSQSELDLQTVLVARRLATMYKVGRLDLVDVLANSASLTDVQSQIVFFRRISQQDERNGAGLARLNEQVLSIERALEKQRQDARAAQDEIDARRLDMNDRIAQRRAILDDLTRKIEAIIEANRPGSAPIGQPVPLNGHYTPLTWAKALLQQIGMPLTGANVAAVTAWEMAEGGHWHNSAHYNPLNTTQPEPGATSMNSVGVKAYLSWAQGFRATITTLHNGYYEKILAALRAGNDAIAVSHAVAASPWGTGNFDHLL